MPEEAMMSGRWPLLNVALVVICLFSVIDPVAALTCPPCPAKPPCDCRVEFGEQILTCPLINFPHLEDAHSNSQLLCTLRIERSNFTEIPGNAFAKLSRSSILIDSSNLNLAVLKAFAFNNTKAGSVTVGFGPSLRSIEPNAFTFGKKKNGSLSLTLKNSSNTWLNLTPEIFLGADAITHLILRQSFSRISKGLFQHLSGLQDLWKPDDWQLTDVEPGSFLGLENLRKLDLTAIRIPELSPRFLAGLSPKLNELKLNGESIYRKPTSLLPDNDAFANLTGYKSRLVYCALIRLKKLWLANLGLTSIPSSLHNISKLNELDLHGNLLKLETFANTTAKQWPKLTNLDLSDNDLTSVPQSLQKLKSLKVVNFERPSEKSIICDSNLCWLASWDKLFGSRTIRPGISLVGFCKAKECQGKNRNEGTADILDYVIESGACNVSTAVKTNYEYNFAAHGQSQAKLQSDVTLYCTEGEARSNTSRLSVSMAFFLIVFSLSVQISSELMPCFCKSVPS